MTDTSLNDMTVLIIEENERLLGPLIHMVRDFGVRTVMTASDGEDGLAVVRERSVDIIISDCRESPVDGLNFARRLRRGEEGPHRSTPIIMLAAPEEQAMAHQDSEIGIDEFLCKPVSPSSLYSRMLSIANKPREFVDTESYTGPDWRETPRDTENQSADADPAAHGNGESAETPCVAVQSPAPSKVFLKSAHNDIDAIFRAYDEAVEDPRGRRQSVRLIGTLSDIIGGQGRRSGYPLMSDIAASLCDYCRTAPEPTALQLDVIKAHAEAMAAVVADDFSGDDSAVGKALISLLYASAARHDETARALGGGVRRRIGVSGNSSSSVSAGVHGGSPSGASAVTPV